MKFNPNTKLATCRGRGIKPFDLLSYPVLQSCSSWGDPKTALCASFREILKSVKSVINFYISEKQKNDKNFDY
jgi:hypothetical protein